MTTVDYLNTCPVDAFVAEIGFAFENSPWIARAAAADRPFADRNALHAAMVAAVERAGDAAKVALIGAHPDLAGMVGIYSYNGPAILSVVRAAGKAGQVKIVCFDADSETMAGVAAGDIYGTVVQKPFEFGHTTILKMDKYLSGDKTQLADGKILFPTLAVTKDNVDAYQFWRKEMLQINEAK